MLLEQLFQFKEQHIFCELRFIQSDYKWGVSQKLGAVYQFASLSSSKTISGQSFRNSASRLETYPPKSVPCSQIQWNFRRSTASGHEIDGRLGVDPKLLQENCQACPSWQEWTPSGQRCFLKAFKCNSTGYEQLCAKNNDVQRRLAKRGYSKMVEYYYKYYSNYNLLSSVQKKL